MDDMESALFSFRHALFSVPRERGGKSARCFSDGPTRRPVFDNPSERATPLFVPRPIDADVSSSVVRHGQTSPDSEGQGAGNVPPATASAMHAAQCCSKALAPQGDIPTVTRCDGTATALRHAPPPFHAQHKSRLPTGTKRVRHLPLKSTSTTEKTERKAPQQRENSTGLQRGGHPRGSPRKAHPRFILPAGCGLYRRCVSAESPCWPGSAAAACARFPRSVPPLPPGAVSGAPRHLLRYMLHGKLLCLRIVSYRPLSSRLFHLGSVSQQVPSYLPVRVAVLQGRLRPRALALAVKIFFLPLFLCRPLGTHRGPLLSALSGIARSRGKRNEMGKVNQ